jgi:hypothetical protein
MAFSRAASAAMVNGLTLMMVSLGDLVKITARVLARKSLARAF